jgi:LacI family transcriptional regulator
VGTWSAESGVTAFDAILERAPATDAIFVANDQMALGVLRAAHARGIRVPDDVAVVGFDGLEEGAQFTPSLTTIVQPLRELGELGVRELLASTETNGSGVRNRVLATELVIRESAPTPGPVPAEGRPATGGGRLV